eukprot:CAMPEP_0197186878 /NCGR_PEP_ID=MMETSP1423-20130617/14758_1 /TAXON_ID=476441 /ORGANISM="Pseudo-nitzschia heimii, Strain UNC1101" /LENGTH=994 /DNA_ID=CAMNT_0042638305 /DNA_START=59 /DNA_END=3043 /DNA_ORIENTATION=+
MRSSQQSFDFRCEPHFVYSKEIYRSVVPLLISISLFLLSNHTCHGRLSGNDQSDVTNDIDFIGYPRGNFRPLKCNERIDEDPCLTSWTRVFGNGFVFSEMVEIPCGQCIVMNPLRNPLTLSGGLKILGKLVIYANDISLTSILVHGELEIVASKPIDGIPDVSVTWIDSASNRTLSFQAPENGVGSNNICGGERGACGMGRKPFVVAGGKVNIRGLPSPSMPTWVPIYDVDTSGIGSDSSIVVVPEAMQDIYQYQPPKLGCPQDDILLQQDLMTSSIPGIASPVSNAFKASYGANSHWTSNGGLKITNRTHHQHCPVIDLKDVRHCFEAGKTYLLTAKVLLTKDGIVDQSDCAQGKDETSCISIYHLRMSARGIGRTAKIWKEKQSFGSMLGEETTIAIDFNFTSQQIAESNIYELLQLRGPGPGVDMELLEFTLRAPPKQAFPEAEDLCKNLIPTNGNAELLGLSPYPFRSNNDDTHISVVTDESNRYFEVRGRAFAVQNAKKGVNWKNAGITSDILPSCMKPHTKYSFHAEIRMHSLWPSFSEWKLKAHWVELKNSVEKIVAKCQPSQGAWVNCDGIFEPSVDIIEADRFELYLESDPSSYDVDYDVDNLSFKLIESGVDRLILPKSIENLWSVGSEILITSHTSKWDGHRTRRIRSMENHDEEGYVQIGLSEAIDRPLTLGLHPFHATKVALLSRNIVFNGANGAHMTVLKTPDQDQVVQGVEFRRFGEESVHNSYPIHFDSCNDSQNSVVSRNTIRESNQRCVVLDETNYVLVEDNVAFGNKGHCFVVETGKEVGNAFISNLGAFSKKSQNTLMTSDYRGKETDDTPAVFWIGGPSNHWVENIAAGSEGFGFWLQPKESHHENTHGMSLLESPHSMPLTEFRNNIAHSTKEESLKITGYNPTDTASIQNFNSYLTNKGHIQVSGRSNIKAFGTILDSKLESPPFSMTDTNVATIEHKEEFESLNQGVSYHESASNPSDVFNLQSSPSLLE